MKTRLITGLLLGGIILLCIFFGNKYTSHLLLVINILGAWELGKMLRPEDSSVSNYLHVILAIVPFLALRCLGLDQTLFPIFLGISISTGIIMIFGLYKKKPYPYRKWSYILAMLYWGLSFSLGAHYLQEGPPKSNLIALGIIILIWTTDTMAYFTGKKWGRTKLFESVSPNKTREGSLGAGISGIIIGSIYGYALDQSVLLWIVIGLLVWIIGTYGDLVESKMKRVANVKDSGNLLPGHGGFLDRFDSLVLVIPFLLLLTVFQ